jgi:hypothetical protein
LHDLFLGLDGLHVVNLLHQNLLVLELITLGKLVQRVVNVLVNLLGITHLFQETTQDASTSHPQHLKGQTRIGGTATLSRSFGTGKMNSNAR